MSDESGYWTKRTLSRRAALRGAALGGAGLAAAGVIGCGGGSTKKTPATESNASPKSTQGVPGGTFSYAPPSPPANLDIFANLTGIRIAGLAYNGLLAFKFGQADIEPTDLSVEPDLAQALPEQPDAQTYVFKLRPAKFHNGRTVTSEDVRYSFDRYARDDKSAYKTFWIWYDHTETPDAQTVVVKTRVPNADTIQNLASTETTSLVHAREHAESAEAVSKFMGTGPYVQTDFQTGASATFKRNPEYHNKPYPYFDEVRAYFVGDIAKRVADFTSKQVDLTYWFAAEQRDQLKKARPDAHVSVMQSPSDTIFMRTDRPPFNDVRVRQGVSMSINRKVIRDGTSLGEGTDDQPLMIANTFWGARQVKDLGAAAKYWTYDPQVARQLLKAAGHDQIETGWMHADATAFGPANVDRATLTIANWKELGLFKINDDVRASAAFNQARLDGKYEGMGHAPLGANTAVGTYLSDYHYTNSAGVRSSRNDSFINDPTLNALIDKQRGEFNIEDRKKMFRQFEDIMAENQYRPMFGTYPFAYFWDAKVQNGSVPLAQTNCRWIQKWWFAK